MPWATELKTHVAKIGVAITRHNRHELGDRCVSEWVQRMPVDAMLFVVDDASNPKIEGADYRFDPNVGIAAAKNKCIELLMDGGVDHLFLADDDIWPKVDLWYRPYIRSQERHLMCLNSLKPSQIRHAHGLTIGTAPRGSLLYMTSGVINKVGGMRTEFPRWGGEHGDFSRRVFHNGMIRKPYMDIPQSPRIWVENPQEPCSVSRQERNEASTLRLAMRAKYHNATEFVEYRSNK